MNDHVKFIPERDFDKTLRTRNIAVSNSLLFDNILQVRRIFVSIDSCIRHLTFDNLRFA